MKTIFYKIGLIALVFLLGITSNYAQKFTQTQKIVADDRASGSSFGISASISSDYAIVGARNDDNFAGAAYIFKKENGTWIQIKKILPSNPISGGKDASFGRSVSISGDYAVVGTRSSIISNTNGGTTVSASSGAVYIFKKDEGGVDNWGQVQRIVASDATSLDDFGASISISNDYMVIGAYNNRTNVAGGDLKNGAGAAYIFKNSNGTWTEEQKLIPSDRADLDQFGISVSISGLYVIVGAYQEDEDINGTNTLDGAGAAYIFLGNGSGTWTQTQKLVASDRSESLLFGRSVSINGDLIVIGSSARAPKVGSAYIFKRNIGTWEETKQITTQAIGFGYPVDISGNYVIIGSEIESYKLGDNTIFFGGAVYVHEKDQDGVDNWGEVQRILPSDPAQSDNFGTSVAISGTQAIVGSFNSEDVNGENTLQGAGSAYMFGIVPEINIKQDTTNIASGGTYDFGNIMVNETSGDSTFTLENTGGATLILSGTEGNLIVLGGTDVDQFSITQTDIPLAFISEGSKTFTVKFSPTSTGEKTANLTIISNDENEGTYTINLRGTGVILTSLSDIENEESIRAYPNPTEDKIIVDNLPVGTTIFVLSDVMGNEVMTGETEESFELDLSSLPAGLYALTLKTSKGTFTRKIVKN